MDKLLILGGAGRVGHFIAGLLQPCISTLTVIDLVAPPAQCNYYVMNALDVVEQAPELLQAATTIVFALPEDIAIAVLERIAQTKPPVNLIINTCSVQTAFHSKTDSLFGGVSSVGVNPIFSPDLNCRGRAVALCEYHESEAGDLLATIIRDHGMNVTRLAPVQHDEIMSLTQSLPHAAILAFAFALRRSNCDMDALHALAPPPMKAMLSLVARMLYNAPETYWEIQKFNSLAQKQRDQIAFNLNRLDELSLEDSCCPFSYELHTVRQHLGCYLQLYSDACAVFFEVLDHSRGG